MIPGTSCGGLVRGASVRQFPVSQGIGGASMRLQPGCLRERATARRLCNSSRIAWPAKSNWPPSFDAAPSWASEIATPGVTARRALDRSVLSTLPPPDARFRYSVHLDHWWCGQVPLPDLHFVAAHFRKCSLLNIPASTMRAIFPA